MVKFCKMLIFIALIVSSCFLIPMPVQNNSVVAQEFPLDVKLPAGLGNPSVTPTEGDTTTIFVFQVTYMDLENDTPSFIYVYINNVNYTMTKLNSGDNNYTDGCIYIYSTNLSVGNYHYQFSTSDGGAVINTSSFSGPTVNQVSPIPGFHSWVVFIGIIGVALIFFTLRKRNADLFEYL